MDAIVKRLNGNQAASTRPRFLTVEAAAEYLSRTSNAVRHLINQGRIPAVKLDPLPIGIPHCLTLSRTT